MKTKAKYFHISFYSERTIKQAERNLSAEHNMLAYVLILFQM